IRVGRRAASYHGGLKAHRVGGRPRGDDPPRALARGHRRSCSRKGYYRPPRAGSQRLATRRSQTKHTRYHGVLAPHSGWRARVGAYGAPAPEPPVATSASHEANHQPTMAPVSRHWAWAELISSVTYCSVFIVDNRPLSVASARGSDAHGKGGAAFSHWGTRVRLRFAGWNRDTHP